MDPAVENTHEGGTSEKDVTLPFSGLRSRPNLSFFRPYHYSCLQMDRQIMEIFAAAFSGMRHHLSRMYVGLELVGFIILI